MTRPACDRFARCLSLAAATLLGASAAGAMPLFSQLPVDDGTGEGYISGVVQEVQNADDFVLTSERPLTAIKWWGSYFGDEPATDNFTIRLFEDAGGATPLPETAPLFEASVSPVTRVLAGFDDAFGITVYEYRASLGAALLLEPGLRYYLSILNDVTDAPDPSGNGSTPADLVDDWYWANSNTTGDRWDRLAGDADPGETTDDVEWQPTPDEVQGVTIGGDLAFVLIPEPAAGLLLALGAALGLTGRVRRTVSTAARG